LLKDIFIEIIDYKLLATLLEFHSDNQYTNSYVVLSSLKSLTVINLTMTNTNIMNAISIDSITIIKINQLQMKNI